MEMSVSTTQVPVSVGCTTQFIQTRKSPIRNLSQRKRIPLQVSDYLIMGFLRVSKISWIFKFFPFIRCYELLRFLRNFWVSTSISSSSVLRFLRQKCDPISVRQVGYLSVSPDVFKYLGRFSASVNIIHRRRELKTEEMKRVSERQERCQRGVLQL